MEEKLEHYIKHHYKSSFKKNPEILKEFRFGFMQGWNNRGGEIKKLRDENKRNLFISFLTIFSILFYFLFLK